MSIGFFMIVQGNRRGRLSSSDEMGFKNLVFMRVASKFV